MNVGKEIYLNIFQHLDQSNLLQCSMVCKAWNLSALYLYYNELIFSGTSTYRLISALDQEDHQYFQHCHWVQAVELFRKGSKYLIESSSNEEEEEEKNLEKEQLLKFLTYLPNLKRLILDAVMDDDYVQYLYDLNSDIYLTQIEEIIIEHDPCNDNNFDLQHDVYYKFRTSLKKIFIFQEEESTSMDTKYGGILNYLTQFKRLTLLCYNDFSESNVSIYQLQRVCPNLTELVLMSGQQLLGYDASLNTSHLQCLELSAPSMSSEFVDMLIDHLPTKLNKLQLHLLDIDLYSWIHLIGIERVLKLAERMSKLFSAEIRVEPFVLYVPESVPAGELQMTLFFQVLNAFKGDKRVLCSANFSDNKPLHKTMTYLNGVLEIDYGLDDQDIHEHDNQDDTTEGLNFELFVPDKTVSNIGLEIINRVKFELYTRDNQLSASKVLTYSLTHCPYLQYVEMNGSRLWTNSE